MQIQSPIDLLLGLFAICAYSPRRTLALVLQKMVMVIMEMIREKRVGMGSKERELLEKEDAVMAFVVS